MIRLLQPFNYRGGLLEPGTILALGNAEQDLIASGAAEKYLPEVEPKPAPEQEITPELEQEPEKPQAKGKKK